MCLHSIGRRAPPARRAPLAAGCGDDGGVAEALPSNDGAARDMNIIISAYTISQILSPLACGLILSALVSHGDAAAGGFESEAGSSGDGGGGSSSMAAYRTIWFSTAAVQLVALPLLLLVKKKTAGR